MSTNAFITGSGSFLPENVITNEALTDTLGLEPERIFKSSGIRSRRWANDESATSSLAIAALAAALKDAGIAAAAVDYLLCGTMTPDRFVPGSAAAIQKGAGLGEIPCLDIRAACCNALYALQLASALVSSGVARHVAICLAEIQSRYLDLTPEAATTSMLFGDGAAAVIVSAEPRAGAIEILDVCLATDGSYIDDLGVRSPGTGCGRGVPPVGVFRDDQRGTGVPPVDSARSNFFPRMNGQSVILQASRRMVAAGRGVLERNRIAAGDVRWIVPHQANANLLAQVARGLGANNAEVISVIEEFGNTSSASMGIALDTLRRSQKIERGDYLLLPAFAAGFTWGAALCQARS
jgi:3-oxoacyl-[acyl-carrier-protein] synthase III